MADENVVDQILAEFEIASPLYLDLSEKAADLLRTMLLDRGVMVHSVTSRAKQRASLERKIRRPDKLYRALQDVTDIAAVRITTYFSEDVPSAVKTVENGFTIDHANSIDKGAEIDPDRFGYRSVHYVASMSKDRLGLVEYSRFAGLKFEIQVRSILQHAWAEIEHDLGYKSRTGIPSSLRRKFARIAGLLELADEEFCSIRGLHQAYVNEVDSRIRTQPADVMLDAVSLAALYKSNTHTKRLDSIIEDWTGKKTTEYPGSYVTYAKRLEVEGIQTIEALEDVARDTHEVVRQLVEYWLPKGEISAPPRCIGLFYLIFVLWWQIGNADMIVRRLVTHHIGDTKDAGKIAKRLLAFKYKEP